jgi:tetratricopeptide (TPR) repeat protein
MFAYDMQVYGRATVIGDSTGGGAHSVDLYPIDDLFEIYIPTARAINPVTSDNWDGTGVIPDVIVPSDAALDTALVLARAAAADFAETKERRLSAAVEVMQRHLDDAGAHFQAGRDDEAALAVDSLFLVGLEARLINEFFLSVLVYEYFGESEEKILFAILNKWIEHYPDSPTAWESMANAYLAHRYYDLAVESFERVLDLAPDNRNAAKLIDRFRNE